MPLLELSHISHGFDYPLFSDVSLSLEPKESVAILGVSGCGKSTLLHIAATLLEPQKGKVFLNNHDIYAQSDEARLRLRRYDVGIIFQAHYLFKGFYAYENIEIASLLSDQAIDDALMKRLGIEGLLGQKVGELSGGQQQRISIARVLSKKPTLIFADEPTGNLDDATANEVMAVLLEYIEEHNGVLLMVTHNQTLAKRCSFVRYLHRDGLQQQA